MTTKPDLDALAGEIYDKATTESLTSDLANDRSIFVRHIRLALQECQERIEELDKQAQAYYNEASDGWSKFREAERRIKELEPDAEMYRWLQDHYKWANDSMRELWFDPNIKAPCLSPPYPVGIVDQDAVARLRAELRAAINKARKEAT